MIESRWLADPQVRRGAVITLLVALLAALGPWLVPHAPTAMVGPVYGPPAAGAPLGHDFLGHDLLSRLLSGGLSVLWMSVAAMAASAWATEIWFNPRTMSPAA